MSDPYQNDHAFTATGPHADTHAEQMWAGATSFCRQRYSRDLTGVDLAVVGVPFDTAVTNRPGTRLGPRAVRAASAQLAWGRIWPSAFDPFQRLSVVDWGDVWFDHARPAEVPAEIEAQLSAVIGAGTGAGVRAGPGALMIGGITSRPIPR